MIVDVGEINIVIDQSALHLKKCGQQAFDKMKQKLIVVVEELVVEWQGSY